MTGRTIAPFRFGDKLGAGGMGSGLLAEDFLWLQIGNDNALSLIGSAAPVVFPNPGFDYRSGR